MNDEQRFHPHTEDFDGMDITIPGVTLRQWYAGQVIQGLCASNAYPCTDRMIADTKEIVDKLIKEFAS